MNQLFGAYVLHPADVWSNNFDNTRQMKEHMPMMFFKAPSQAFDYIRHEANLKSMPATNTPMGQNLNEYMKMPGVGIMFNVNAPIDVFESLQEKRVPGAFVVGYEARLTDMRIMEEKAVLPTDEFSKLAIVEIPDIKDALSARYVSYQLLEQSLANTFHAQRRELTPEWLSGDNLKRVFGPEGMIQKGFQTPYAQDQRFYDVMQALWENNAGMQYMDRVEEFYSKYRDVYALEKVRNGTEDVAQLRAVIAVINRLSDIAKSHEDDKMEDVLKEHGADYAAELAHAEQGDTAR